MQIVQELEKKNWFKQSIISFLKRIEQKGEIQIGRALVDNFINSMIEMRNSLNLELRKSDFDNLIH